MGFRHHREPGAHRAHYRARRANDLVYLGHLAQVVSPADQTKGQVLRGREQEQRDPAGAGQQDDGRLGGAGVGRRVGPLRLVLGRRGQLQPVPRRPEDLRRLLQLPVGRQVERLPAQGL